MIRLKLSSILLKIVCALILILIPQFEMLSIEQHAAKLINTLLPKDYNQNLRPNFGGPRVQMNVSIRIMDISEISETYMDFKVDFLLRHYWRDSRLAYNKTEFNINQVTLGAEFSKKIWLPDTYLANGKDTQNHKTISSDNTVLLRVGTNGDILHSTRILLLAHCPMDLRFFPFDQQRCSIEMGNYGHSDEEVVYEWINNSMLFSPHIYFPEFNLRGYSKYRRENRYSTGTYTYLIIDLFLCRSLGYYISQVYVPAFLIVVISWVPFWLDQDDHHARVALGVTTVLTMTTLISSSNQEFPKMSHINAIDVFLFICFIFVFFALIEYATVGYYSHQYKLQMQKMYNTSKNAKQGDEMQNNLTSASPFPDEIGFKVRYESRFLFDRALIDERARKIFPIGFFAFNVMYIIAIVVIMSTNSRNPEIQFFL